MLTKHNYKTPRVKEAAVPSPFTHALALIKEAPEDRNATALAKLILSLYSESCAFGVRECLGSLDPVPRQLAHQMLESFSQEAEILEETGKTLILLYPALWDIGCAMSTARLLRQRRHNAERGLKTAA